MTARGMSATQIQDARRDNEHSAVSAGYPTLAEVMDTIRTLRLGHQMYETADVSEDYARAHVTFHGAMQKLFQQLNQYVRG